MNLNATLFAQLIVFFILAWFTMKFVWPPIMNAIDEITKKIAEGLSTQTKQKLNLLTLKKKLNSDCQKQMMKLEKE